MFDKIAMADNVIKIIRYTIEQELPAGFDDKGNIEYSKETDIAFSEIDKDNIVEQLKSKGIKFEVSAVQVPIEFEKYDGMVWNKGRDEALKMINGDPSYQIEELENKLDNDYRYKKRIDGEYTDEEWEPIATERRAWRVKLRELKSD